MGVFVKVTTWRGGTCPAGLLHGEILLSILRCLGRPPAAKNYLAPNVSRTEVGETLGSRSHKDRQTASSDFDPGAGGRLEATWLIARNHSYGST